jgi:hypothetical protein
VAAVEVQAEHPQVLQVVMLLLLKRRGKEEEGGREGGVRGRGA